MSPGSKIKHLEHVNKLIAEQEKQLALSKQERDTVDSAIIAHYDLQREAFASGKDLKDTQLSNAKEFKQFLENSEDMDTIYEGAEVTIRFKDNDRVLEGAIYAPISIRLDKDTQILTSQSPIGKAIRGKMTGQQFTYQAENTTITGLIEEVR